MRSRVFVVFAVTLCFVFCLCAQATVSKEEAIKAVNNAKRLIASALDNAGRELNNAEEVKLTIEWRKKKTEKILSEAKAAPNQKAVNAAVVQTISELENMLQLYPSAKDKIDNAVKSLTNVYLEARVLNEEAKIKISPASGLSNDYTNVKESASTIQTQAEQFQKDIQSAKTLLSEAQVTLNKMPYLETNDKMEMYKADGILIAERIPKMLTEADSAMQNIKQKKNEVNAAVESISEILQKHSNDLRERINVFLTTANNNLKTISQRVIEVQQDHETILSRKENAETSTETLKKATDEKNARKEHLYIQNYAERSEFALERIKKALNSAEQSLISANQQKQSAIEETKKKDSTINAEVNVLTERHNPNVVNRDTIQKNKDLEPQIKNTMEEPAEEVTKKLTSTDADGQTKKKSEKDAEGDIKDLQKDANVKQPMIDHKTTIIETSQNSALQTSNQPEMEKTVQTKDKKSEELNLDSLRKGAKNITNISFVGENAQTSGDWSDSALNVSVSLLAALISFLLFTELFYKRKKD